jgi:CubicO group peptidase (beta-lactamase class C family)/D-alanyl-D-alanine dipeptidase
VSPTPTSADAPPAKYAAAVDDLRRWVEKEVAAKRIPALSLALVDDQTVIWSGGFGYEDDARTHAAGPKTMYRVGSVSKPITALLLMLYVEQGILDLDAPVQDYLRSFQPENKSGKAITLRQILSHRSGLVREPPVGNYFDANGPSLADTVKSLNRTSLVYPPESKTSYSNAAPSVAGYVLERRTGEPFATLIRRKLLEPIGMTGASFDPSPEIRAHVPKAVMWTYHGREFPAPTFDLGMAPAGSLYASVDDLAQLIRFLFAGGKGPGGRVMSAETLEKMMTIQFAKAGDKAGFGLGFFVSEFEGQKRIGHGGAVYGFATELAVLPESKLGVIVCSAHDVSNGLTQHIADVALRHMLAVRAGKPLPTIDETTPIGAEAARSLAGRYRNGDKTLELEARGGRLWAWPPRSGAKIEMRRLGDRFVFDDVLAFAPGFTVAGKQLVTAKDTYEPEPSPEPKPLPAKWEGLIGEYGPDHNICYVLEKDGVLHALIEWVFLYPLREISEDTYLFPDFGLYHGHELVFRRDASGRATAIDAAGIRMERRPLPRPGETFKLTPIRPIVELRPIALAATPPKENNVLLRKPDLVEVTSLEPTIRLDLRYASDNNFLGTPLYTSARAFLQRPAAEALIRAHKKLEKDGVGILIHDTYRPWFVTKMFRDAVPPRYHLFVADPLEGSRHNRGCAADVSLFDRKTGKAVDMVGGYDEFTDRSYPDYPGGTSIQRRYRELLRRAMEDESFTVYQAEWWHFDYRDWRQYPIMNVRFEDLKRETR